MKQNKPEITFWGLKSIYCTEMRGVVRVSIGVGERNAGAVHSVTDYK